ncbi:MAG: fimbrillin family protein [Bacteroidaceae bacterium]|nr:fimbrillin family protein [Bacteroidaceae bacterium]
MKTRSVLKILTISLLMLSGCKDEKPQYGAPISLRVTGVMGRPDLDAGLKLGLFVDEPVKADNVPLTVQQNGVVVADGDLKWMFNQTQSSRFFIYAPYDPSFSGQEIVTFNAPQDQSTEDKLLEGNLLTAISSGSPKDQAVNLKLKHAMTAMNVSFDNRSGYRIDSISVGGFMTEGSLNLLTGTLTATGGKARITPLRSSADENSFSFIYIPQNTTPVFRVFLSSGKTIVFTFNKDCHEYPGSIIKMQLQIDESTPSANMLALNGVNLTQWTDNGVPAFTELPAYINLDGLKNVEPDMDRDGFFSAYLNKVTVTAVDRTSADVLGLILEDSTKAIHVWADNDSPLTEGNTIVGPVLGLMNKTDEGEVNISHFYTSYATVRKTDELPLTVGTFRDVSRTPAQWEYRRMLFKGVTLQAAFRNDRAVFAQNGTRMSVICPGIDIQLAQGARGNLIGFPVISGTDIMIMVYDQSVFNLFSKEVVNNTLTNETVFGLYDMSMRDTALYAMTGTDRELQYSSRRMKAGLFMQVADTHNGEAHVFLVYDCPEEPLVGHEYTVAFNATGNSQKKSFTVMMECIKSEDNRAWLIDRQNDYGLVIAL